MYVTALLFNKFLIVDNFETFFFFWWRCLSLKITYMYLVGSCIFESSTVNCSKKLHIFVCLVVTLSVI